MFLRIQFITARRRRSSRRRFRFGSTEFCCLHAQNISTKRVLHYYSAVALVRANVSNPYDCKELDETPTSPACEDAASLCIFYWTATRVFTFFDWLTRRPIQTRQLY